MCASKMHADEVSTDAALVRRLIAAQFPRWAGLPVEPIDSAGTSNAMYRLGQDMVVRLPRLAGAAHDVEKEHRWLPQLAPLLPCDIPVPLGKGTPALSYPWHWSVYRWLDGENPSVGSIAEPGLLAEDLAEFVTALHRIDPTDGPPSYRSEPLADRDTATRAAIAELRGIVDTDAATTIWEAALRVPEWSGPAVWLHADLQPGNLLMARGRLSAVIDFGCLGLGDPAVDLISAWYLLPADTRGAFRAALEVDDAAWARGRGWALSIALLELRYYRHTNPVMATIARHVIEEVLTDHDRAE
ncbi:aminoglycoside phosphotransferase family protein [Streptomyces sp. NBC_01481]|uniref:aminoglycoside phosphotransferase family protein n=1 Tax=Streptomyces sp. NBC_01481 TaxID=2975869 RepID=UPI00224D4CC6|nr:aminoglycoside phosphotransferase family protein [Streptomyces sp. NBC_01481]MCX4584053.1 aminoglycoside phosphotransferase family protein [Streptomyces sp. NBC_01481]